MKMFIFFILLSVSSFADEICDPTRSFDQPRGLFQMITAIATPQKTVTPAQYASAPCKTIEVPEYNWWLQNHGNEIRPSSMVKGFNFQNQQGLLIDAFRDIVKNMPDRRSSCTTVLCAVDEIWGAEIGRKILYIRARHGYNTSELAFERTRQLKSSELDDIIITLGDLPQELEMIGKDNNQRMTMELEGVVSPKDPLASADSTIMFYDRWRNSSNSFRRRYGLFHEFGHNVSFMAWKVRRDRKPLDSTAEWLSMASCPVSTYGEKDRGEDFAESFVMYRFNGQALKQNCPEKYDYLKREAFKGREFLSNSECY